MWECYQNQNSSSLYRIVGLVDCITYAVFQYTRRGLFERHKLIFATQLCFKIMRKNGQIEEKELEFLVQGKKVLLLTR